MARRKPQESQASIARRHGVSPQILCRWKKAGLDVHDEKAVAERAAGKNPGKAPPEPPPSEPREAESYGVAQARWKSAQADKEEIAVSRAKGEVVAAESVLSSGMKIGLAIRQSYLKMESELTPRVAGLPSTKVAKVLRAYAREKLTELRDLEYVGDSK